jgi:hypothetical protein
MPLLQPGRRTGRGRGTGFGARGRFHPKFAKGCWGGGVLGCWGLARERRAGKVEAASCRFVRNETGTRGGVRSAGGFWIPHKAAGCRFYSRGGERDGDAGRGRSAGEVSPEVRERVLGWWGAGVLGFGPGAAIPSSACGGRPKWKRHPAALCVTRRGRGAGFGARGFLDSPQSGRMPLLQQGRRTGRRTGRGSERGGGFIRSFRRVLGCWGVGVLGCWGLARERRTGKVEAASCRFVRNETGTRGGVRSAGFSGFPTKRQDAASTAGAANGTGTRDGGGDGGGFTRSFRRGAGVVGCWGAGVWPGSGGRAKWKRHPAALCVTRRGRGAGFGARGFLDSPQSGRMPLLQQGRRTGRGRGRGSERGGGFIRSFRRGAGVVGCWGLARERRAGKVEAASCRFVRNETGTRGGVRSAGFSGFPTKRQDAASTAGAANGTGTRDGVRSAGEVSPEVREGVLGWWGAGVLGCWGGGVLGFGPGAAGGQSRSGILPLCA